MSVTRGRRERCCYHQPQQGDTEAKCLTPKKCDAWLRRAAKSDVRALKALSEPTEALTLH